MALRSSTCTCSRRSKTHEQRLHRADCGQDGSQRLYTGLGKWTHIAATGVERHLISLGLAEIVKVDVNGPHSMLFEMLYITPLGREVAEYLAANWESLSGAFRDGRKNPY